MYERKLTLLQIAQPSVREARRATGGSARHIATFHEANAEAPAHPIESRAASNNATPHNEEIKGALFGGGPQRRDSSGAARHIESITHDSTLTSPTQRPHWGIRHGPRPTLQHAETI